MLFRSEIHLGLRPAVAFWLCDRPCDRDRIVFVDLCSKELCDPVKPIVLVGRSNIIQIGEINRMPKWHKSLTRVNLPVDQQRTDGTDTFCSTRVVSVVHILGNIGTVFCVVLMQGEDRTLEKNSRCDATRAVQSTGSSGRADDFVA